MLKSLEGAEWGWARGDAALLLALEMLPLNHLLCLCCVTGPGGHAWTARVSSKYHSDCLPSVPPGCAHSVPSTWNALLHLHDQALVPSSCNLSLLAPTWSDLPLWSVPQSFIFTFAVVLFCLE